ncbi:pyruvate dehydrogenase E2 component (dihydrolipoamide acetyltransferase) [Oceanospirillum multiglobuliferum]|uniref:Dihydrolipoamide acetyltransferase component of pyruvate dehydrogenase complex n=1 Tax=Oceanospirillum multiglobuliferum TaxID=64969 RepID=A0A1T4R4F5_9GAMM|nr:2-oxo acid dehydrogenase subunit E2 [Oceanospirillum multiglobuliferum]OPX55238.1 hypothetical protein BTE48_09900 [Oceanospirillum multiglobuliferum]SKA10912.1 pyruvate dehydrogenase E2 component (dihydrolipoamide acetyltransferase) [Oceanospirillum multiglobuliferum]
MATEIVFMPEVDGSGDVIEYCVELGAQIAIDDPLIVFESDKASMEVPSAVEGILVEWLVELGSKAESGTPLARIELVDTVSEVEKNKTSEVAEKTATAVEQPLVEETAPAQSVTIETITMPEVEGSGDVIEYCVDIGSQIEIDDPLIVFESDKASMEVPASAKGVLIEWLVELGSKAESGTPLARVEVVSSARAGAQNKVSAQPAQTPAASVSHADSIIPQKPVTLAPAVTDIAQPVVSAEVYAGPATRKLARELGVALNKVQGSGNRGRILKDDVKRFVKQQMSQPQVSAAQSLSGSGIPAMPTVDFSQFGDIEEKTLSGIAKATSAHMTRCWLNIPHVTLFDEVDISELERFRARCKPEQYGMEKKPTVLPFIIMIIAKALRRYPQFNSALSADGETLIYKQYINIGIAVDTPAGLVVPVIKNADQKSIAELSQEIANYAAKARDRKLKAEDMQGGCFTISSLGAMGGTGFTPIINGPEVAILGVARSEIKPVWNGETFLPATKLPLSLSFDHRVINGADAGRFMSMVHQCLADIGCTLL